MWEQQDLDSADIWSEKVRCSSKIKTRLRAEWVVLRVQFCILASCNQKKFLLLVLQSIQEWSNTYFSLPSYYVYLDTYYAQITHSMERLGADDLALTISPTYSRISTIWTIELSQNQEDWCQLVVECAECWPTATRLEEEEGGGAEEEEEEEELIIKIVSFM